MPSPEHHVVILGAGPAGLGTALWCRALGLSATVFDRDARAGGQLHGITGPIHNVPGLPGVTGARLADDLLAQATHAGAVVRLGAASFVDVAARSVAFASGDRAHGDALVIATGTRRRKLCVDGEAAFAGRGVCYNIGASAPEYAGRDVAVVGGGDDAYEHAALLAPYSRRIYLVQRRDARTARDEYARVVHVAANVTRVAPATVVRFVGDAKLAGVEVATAQGARFLDVTAAFVCIGPEPNSEGFAVAKDSAGYVRTDGGQRTSAAGVYAVGDVCCPQAPTIASAFGHGAVAAKSIVADLSWRAGLRPPTRHDGADRLTVTGIAVPAQIGVYPREQDRTQTLRFDVWFAIDAARIAPGDALRGTVDYAAVAARIASVAAARHYHLIETVADVVARDLLHAFEVTEVGVRVCKPDVPVEGASASVEVTRRR